MLIQAHHTQVSDMEAGEGSALVVERVEADGVEDTYARVGFLELTTRTPEGFVRWIENNWEVGTIKLV